MSERIWLLESLYKRIDRDPYTCTLYVATVLTGNINVTKHVSRFVKGSTNLRQIQAELRDHLDAINFPKKKKNSEPFTSAQIHRETMEVVRYRSLGKSHCRISSEHSNGTTFCSLESFRAAVNSDGNRVRRTCPEAYGAKNEWTLRRCSGKNHRYRAD